MTAAADTQGPAAHLRAILALGLPLIGSHLAQFSIHLTDTLMLGWYDVEALAASVLAVALYFVLFLVGSGFAWAVMPLVASAAAQSDTAQMRRVVRMGLWLSAAAGVVSLAPLLLAEPLFRLAGQDARLSALAADYLGLRGAAIASVVSQLGPLVVLAAYVSLAPVTRAQRLFARLWRVDRTALVQVFRLGWPIGLTTLAEVGLFSAAAVMIGWIGTAELAAHGIAMEILSGIFMIHVGLSQVATVRAGQALGRGDGAGLKRGAQLVLGCALAVALATAVVLLTMPEPLIRLFLDPADPALPAVVATGTALLAVAALFQIADSTQIITLGLLRGVRDTRVPMWLAALSYWAVGVPAAWAMGFGLGWGAPGVWGGLVVGLVLAGASMSWRFWRRDFAAAAGVPQPDVSHTSR
ncbi:MAG: MATE family efflux transporter [Alphaproteobacteria bacterium HGW-Alphaproteobacteria-2]|nr:MAG: MATE family efflux transporter [Alphaproteobacteria bacterium HGW-Alphaproteobacteria-2]